MGDIRTIVKEALDNFSEDCPHLLRLVLETPVQETSRSLQDYCDDLEDISVHDLEPHVAEWVRDHQS